MLKFFRAIVNVKALIGILIGAALTGIGFLWKRHLEKAPQRQALESLEKGLQISKQLKDLGLLDLLIERHLKHPGKDFSVDRDITPGERQKPGAKGELSSIDVESFWETSRNFLELLAIHAGNEAIFGEALQKALGEEEKVLASSVNNARRTFYEAFIALSLISQDPRYKTDPKKMGLLKEYAKRIPAPTKYADIVKDVAAALREGQSQAPTGQGSLPR